MWLKSIKEKITKCDSKYGAYTKQARRLVSILEAYGHRAYWSPRHNMGYIWCEFCTIKIKAKHIDKNGNC